MASSTEILDTLYDAWNRDDFEAARALIHPNVEWHTSGVFPGLEPVYRGHDGVRQWWLAVKEPFDHFNVLVEREHQAGRVVVAEVRFEAVGRESGVEVKLPFAHVFEIEDDLIMRYWSYDSLEAALAAHGG